MRLLNLGRIRPVRGVALLAAAMIVAAGCSRTRPLSREDLAGRAEVRRDAFGVPHVKGETIPAAVYGFGYAQAEDQIGGIMKRVLNARGELAKHFGPSLIEKDVFARRFHVHNGGRELATMSPEVRRLFEAYAVGVNAYIEDHRADLPEWIQPITAADILAASRAALMGFAFNRGDVIGKIQSEHKAGSTVGAEAASAAASAEEERGSNMWALSPSRTTSGRAILMGNPHLPWELTWYEGHLTVPGEYNIYGAAFVGGPVPTIAFNEALGWSHTVNYPDTEDVYVFREDPEHCAFILYDGASHPLKPVRFSVEVKQDAGMETKEFLFWETEFGPVVHRADGKVWVLKSSVLEQDDYVEQWYRMGRAKNLKEFRAALDLNAIPMFNVIYADRDGHIYYRWMARLPRRPAGQDGSGEIDASDTSAIWSEVHASEEMPQLTDPKGGYVQNSNDAPWYTSLVEPIPAEKYPPYTEAPRLRLRSQHGLSLINNYDKFSLGQVIEMKHSPRLLAAERICDDLVADARAAAAESTDAAQAEELYAAAGVLASWDGTTARESRGGTLFALWWERYAKENKAIWAVEWDAADPTGTPRGLGDRARGVSDLVAAARQCKADYGSLDVAWGDAHRMRRGALDLPMNGGPGEMGSFRVIDYKNAEDGKYVAYGGDGWVFAVEFGETPEAYSVLAYGQSEDETAEHATDQAAMFIDGELKRVLFNEADVERGTVKRYRP